MTRSEEEVEIARKHKFGANALVLGGGGGGAFILF